mgnify:CR=1 FL=1
MLLYLVEDDPLKAAQIAGAVEEEIEGVIVEIYRSYNTGLTAVRSMPPDVLLTDMSLPTFDRSPGQRTGRLRPLGGYELMLKAQGKVRSAIVITMLQRFGDGDGEISVQDVRLMCEEAFPHFFKGLVRFVLGGAPWRQELIDLLRRARSDG